MYAEMLEQRSSLSSRPRSNTIHSTSLLKFRIPGGILAEQPQNNVIVNLLVALRSWAIVLKPILRV